MISIQGMKINEENLHLTDSQKNIYLALKNSSQLFIYQTIQEFMFELTVRDHIIQTAKILEKSGAGFAPFNMSSFNLDLWTHTKRGYALKSNVVPAAAIRDIFRNSELYSFECSTAIIIILYKAVLESLSEAVFNNLFQDLFLWDWNYDKDLGIITQLGKEFIPGDIVYFYNPDFDHPIWTGENAVFLGDDTFYGHGVGIRSSEGMIEELNKLRKKDAKTSAFLLSQHSRLDFKYLFTFSI